MHLLLVTFALRVFGRDRNARLIKDVNIVTREQGWFSRKLQVFWIIPAILLFIVPITQSSRAQTAACPESNPSVCGNGYNNGAGNSAFRYGGGGGGSNSGECYNRCLPVYKRCMGAGNVAATCGAYLQRCQASC
jgi:hypothetical protein